MTDPRRAHRFARARLAAALAGLTCAAQAALVPAAWARPAELGTVETVAGPGFCDQAARIDPASTEVRSLAVDPTGQLFVDTGPPDEGLVATVDLVGRTSALRTGVSGGLAGRLVSDRAGGIVVATAGRIDHLGQAGRVIVAGDPIGASGVASGDGGPAHAARFAAIESLASDEHGNLYVADATEPTAGAVRIRFVNRGSEPITFYRGTADERTVAPGHIDTIAGAVSAAQDTARATAAGLEGTSAIAAVDRRLYIASVGPQDEEDRADAGGRVRMVNLSGEAMAAHGVTIAPATIAAVAGGGSAEFGGDRGPALRAGFGELPGLAADDQGNLYVADAANHRVRMVDADGTVVTIAGTGSVSRGGFNGNERPAAGARLNTPSDVEVGPGPALYVSDEGNSQVRFIDANGMIHAALGNATALAWHCGDDPSSTARPRAGVPTDVTADDAANVYFVVAGAAVVYRLDPSGVVAPVVGSASPASCTGDGADCAIGDGGPAADALLGEPVAVAAAPHGGLYLLDAAHRRLRFANLGSRPVSVHGRSVPAGVVTTVAAAPRENPEEGGDDDRPERFTGPASLVVDTAGNVYIADARARSVFRLDAAGALTTVVEADGSALRDPSICCRQPAGLAVDDHGNLYISDAASSRVWFSNLGSTPVTVHGRSVKPGATEPIVGSGDRGFGDDGGPAAEAQLQGAAGVATDQLGNLYVVDADEHTLRKVDTAGIISTVVGTGSPGFNGDGLKGRLTALYSPADVALDHCGNVLIADGSNGRVRRLNTVARCTPDDAHNDEQAGVAAGGTSLLWLAPLLAAAGGVGVAAARRGGWAGRRRLRRGGVAP